MPSFGIVSYPAQLADFVTNSILAQEMSLAQDVDLERSQSEEDIEPKA